MIASLSTVRPSSSVTTMTRIGKSGLVRRTINESSDDVLGRVAASGCFDCFGMAPELKSASSGLGSKRPSQWAHQNFLRKKKANTCFNSRPHFAHFSLTHVARSARFKIFSAFSIRGFVILIDVPLFQRQLMTASRSVQRIRRHGFLSRSRTNSAITRTLRLGRNSGRPASGEASIERTSMRIVCGEMLVAEIS